MLLFTGGCALGLGSLNFGILLSYTPIMLIWVMVIANGFKNLGSFRTAAFLYFFIGSILYAIVSGIIFLFLKAIVATESIGSMNGLGFVLLFVFVCFFFARRAMYTSKKLKNKDKEEYGQVDNALYSIPEERFAEIMQKQHTEKSE